MALRVVLVHGAWGSPQMWDAVRDGLTQDGIASEAADLPTMQRADATFDLDVAHVRDLIGDDPTIVCAHSYGGMVATAAAAGLANVEHLVYLAAGMPAIGESMFDWIVKRPNPAAAPLDFRDDGTSIPTAWAQDNGGGYDAATLARWAAIPPRPFVVSAAVVPASAEPWRTVPSTYVVATRDVVLDPESQREMAVRATSSVEWDIGHMAHLALPGRASALLAALAPS